MSKRRILITGAGGFVGGRLVEGLHLAGFGEVRAGVRRWRGGARAARFPVEIVLCDIMNRGQVAQAMEDVTHVIHCAYRDNREIIVEGTANLLAAAFNANVQRFIYLSTAEVYGRDVSGEVNERCDCVQTGSVYADSKIEAERACWEYYDEGLSVTVLRPSIIFGPFGESWTIDMAKRLQSGNWGVFQDDGDGICNLVYVDDLARAIATCLKSPLADGETFNISGGYEITWNDYFERFNSALHLPPLEDLSVSSTKRRTAIRDRLSKASGFFLNRYGDQLMDIYLRGGIASKVMKRTKQFLTTTPSRRELQNLYSRRAKYDATKASEVLDWNPQYGLDEALSLTCRWLRHHGYVDR